MNLLFKTAVVIIGAFVLIKFIWFFAQFSKFIWVDYLLPFLRRDAYRECLKTLKESHNRIYKEAMMRACTKEPEKK